MNTLVLERFSYAPDGTYGIMSVGDMEFYTVERPWVGNAVGLSCIPEGVYQLGKRHSPMVKRTSGGKYDEGWEVLDVPERTFIMIHPANYPSDLEGCIGLGLSYQIMEDRKGDVVNGVGSSRKAFDAFMNATDVSDYWDLEVIPKMISYP